MRAKLPMSHAPRKDVKSEIRRRVADENDKYMRDFEVMVLWVLHSTFGFGKTRLERFYKMFLAEHAELRKRYEIGAAYAAEYKLKQIGIDIEKLWEDNKP